MRTDVGVDLICDAADSERLTAALAERGAWRSRESAAEFLRVECGRPRFGLDMDDTTIPQEAALNERAVSFTKGCYVGQETVARLFYKGKPNRHLRGLRLSAPAATGEELRLGERVSGMWAARSSPPRSGRSRWRSCGARRSPARRSSVGEHGTTAVVVQLPFAI